VAYGAAAFAPDRWRRVVTLGVPPLALDTRIFADYDQLKRFFYLFFLKTPFAESVLAAEDMAGLVPWLRRERGSPERQAVPARRGQPRGGDRLLPGR
jgi:hypothetical protein